ncbi:hypothetical protein [Neisseria bacilliformis]|uniref:hypothetical protein n=1 Tax=Neisseria bacilliformis TaxID=267212 RepID=UPI003C73694B
MPDVFEMCRCLSGIDARPTSGGGRLKNPFFRRPFGLRPSVFFGCVVVFFLRCQPDAAFLQFGYEGGGRVEVFEAGDASEFGQMGEVFDGSLGGGDQTAQDGGGGCCRARRGFV